MFTREEARTLLEPREGPHVSLLTPLHRAGQGHEQDVIRFRNQLRRVREDLVALGWRGPTADELLSPAARLIEAHQLWGKGGAGQAVFIAPRFYRAWRVPVEVSEVTTVADSFHVKPLLPLLKADGAWFVLALSGNQVRLLQCTRAEVRQVTLENGPINMDDALQHRVMEPSLQGHPTSDGGRMGMGGGHGVGEERPKSDLIDYFRVVDKALRPVLRGETGPLVLASVGYHHPLFASVTSYPYLLSRPLEGSWDVASDKELHERALPLVEPELDNRMAHDSRRLLSMVETKRVASDLQRVMRAALSGRVDVLFVATGVQCWGLVDRSTGTVLEHEEELPGDLDLLNEAAIATIQHGGAVHAVPREQIPTGAPWVAGLMRW